MNILKLVVIAWGITFAFSAGAASKAAESSKPEIKTRDAASGLPTGKRQHKLVSSSLGKPKDAASGMPTGKRQHKPLSSVMISYYVRGLDVLQTMTTKAKKERKNL